ncbi:MAG: DUF362 domain-containing protein [Acidobacteriota bacterium]|jgi:hypothetical protein
MKPQDHAFPDFSRPNRRAVLRTMGLAASSLALGVPSSGQEKSAPARPETNVADFLAVPRGPHALPGPFPGRVVQVTDRRCLVGDRVQGRVVAEMFEQGLARLTGRPTKDSFKLFFTPTDVVGIKINPVGAPLLSTRVELVDAVISWLERGGLPRERMVIWDRFAPGLEEAGFTPARFPGVAIEGMQTMAGPGQSFRRADGSHLSLDQFDPEHFYVAKGVEGKGVRGYRDDEYYLNQHVVNGEVSYFGKLITQRLTKIINLAVFKNTGNGVSMATKNIAYAAICNTGRLHVPLFFDVCTEVLAAPVVREKLVLSVIDGIRGQYEDGPGKNEKYMYPYHTLYLATDPFALDTVGHHHLLAKRKAMGVQVNEHPRFTDYLRYAERLGLGVADPRQIQLLRVQA